MLAGLLPIILLKLMLLGLRSLPAIPKTSGSRLTLGSAHSLTHAEPRSGGVTYDAEASWLCRVRQKPKMEIVLTKSAEFDAIVAEENEPNAADFGDYYGAHVSEMSCSALSWSIV